MSTGLSALIFGGTGATGKHLLRELLSSEKFSKVGEYGRRVTPPADLPGKEKLEQKVIDFENLDSSTIKIGQWDVIFITLGTSRTRSGAEAFEKIDRGYVLNVAKAARSDDPTHKQRLVYLSSAGAHSKSHFLYTRSKGLTEDGLAAMGYDCIVFRPGLLTEAEREKNYISPIVETLLKSALTFAGYFMNGGYIPVATLAKGIRHAGELGSAEIPPTMKSTESHEGLSFTLIGNDQAHQLANLP